MNKMTRILLILVGLVLIIGGAAGIRGAVADGVEAAGVPFETTVELNDGAGNPVATLSTRCIFNGEERQVGVAYTLVNHGERALTQLNFSVTYLDSDGNDLRGKSIYVMIGLMDAPVQPGEAREFVKRHYFDGAEATASVVLDPIDVKDEVELPPWTEPQPGNLLLDFCNYAPFSAYFENLDTNPPVKMEYHKDQTFDETVTDVDEILAEIESLRNMRIGGESDIRVTDSGISYWFTMADGTEWGVSFEAPGLFCWHNKVYEVLHD